MRNDSLLVALAGGVGASKLLAGLIQEFPARRLAVIGNTGDDILLHGLRICPDLDTVLYTLAGRVNQETGWGVARDTFVCLDQMKLLQMPTWFRLGDRDLALHILRTRLLKKGWTLTQVTQRLCQLLKVEFQLAPMAEGYFPTFIEIEEGEVHLQEYLIRHRCRPAVKSVRYCGIEQARMTESVQSFLANAQALVICPSNPFISVGPILAVPGMREAVSRLGRPVVAVTPIVAGRALKGPAARMLEDLGYEVSAYSVAHGYRGIASHFVLDQRDEDLAPRIRQLGLKVSMTDTVMKTQEDRGRLARHILELF